MSQIDEAFGLSGVRSIQVRTRDIAFLVALIGVETLSARDVTSALLPYPYPVPSTAPSAVRSIYLSATFLKVSFAGLAATATLVVFLATAYAQLSVDGIAARSTPIVTASLTCVGVVVVFVIGEIVSTGVWYTVVDGYWVNPTALAGWRSVGNACLVGIAIIAVEVTVERYARLHTTRGSSQVTPTEVMLILVLQAAIAIAVCHVVNALPRDQRFIGWRQPFNDITAPTKATMVRLIVTGSFVVVAAFLAGLGIVSHSPKRRWLPSTMAAASCAVFIIGFATAMHTSFATGAGLARILSIPTKVLMQPQRIVNPGESSFRPL